MLKHTRVLIYPTSNIIYKSGIFLYCLLKTSNSLNVSIESYWIVLPITSSWIWNDLRLFFRRENEKI